MSEKIVEECDGLPLAIAILGRTLRNKGKRFWDVVNQQLRKSRYGGMSSVIDKIKLSYDFLETSETKLCFLLCALFPEDHKVTMDALVGYAMGENLLGEVETLSEARENLHIMVETLVSSGLLLKGEDDDYVMMHDIVPDTAISIARENRNESIISVRSLMEIPDGFFKGMKCLATLDLSDIGIKYLPQSLSCLENCLRTLYLDYYTKLLDISLIGNLKALKILSLDGTEIPRLPQEISGLTNLMMLDLSYNQNLKCIPPKVILSLSSLEVSYMIGSFRGWKIEGSGDNASLAEVASLTNLTSLYLSIEHAKWLSTDIGKCHHWEKLENFYVRVGYSFKFEIANSERCVSLKTRSDSYPVAAWVNVLMGRTYYLRLEWCEGLKNVLQLNPKDLTPMEDTKTLELLLPSEKVTSCPPRMPFLGGT
ncbi:hypothetical protein GIB67_004055 [Kingdonia uniflora]|uniref:NB-ARC domain-containing protein n=1 Tax=Kingdonia uniflora TaxID=39325 RepID=A0A7J7NRE0_9MAGN|nr:hypothetical protein GIB67_004055 [Kingdonia uniflora]